MSYAALRWAIVGLAASALVGCGGDGGGSAPPVVPPGASTSQIIAAAAADPANDSATNSAAPFTVMQSTTVPAVQVNSPPVVNFTVFSDGKVVQGLTNANVRFAIAKLTPGSGGDPDEWANYIYRKETANPPYGPNGTPVLPSAWQATTDPNTPASLVYNADGYYTYTFTTDITDPNKTNGVVYEPGKTHRIAIQLSYKNAAGETVLVNPYFDFTIGADGKAITVTDPNATRVMADVNSCNGCHEKLALHGGGRVDVQYCVMCHNPGTTDANSGNVLTMATMTHQIHAGRLLANTPGGVNYTIWGYQNSKHDYSEVGFPQDLRNCSVCHSSDPTKTKTPTPQGDNWKTKVSKEACLTCHANNPGSDWNTSHTTYFGGTDPKTMTNQQCWGCHNPASNPALSPERVHWNQNEENAALYKMNIESATYDAATRNVTVKYFLSNPTNGDAAYDLSEGCASPTSCTSLNKFGNVRLYLAYQNMVGQFPAMTEFSSYNNGGSGARVDAYKGTKDANNHYTIDIPVPADTATQVAFGTARVLSIGQVKEVKLAAKSAADPRPPVVPLELINTLVQNTYKDVALTGTLMARRDVVSNEKCNVCHGALGATSGSNTLANAFHSGARNTVEACALCHDANRVSSSTKMTDGTSFNESYQFKRMIHGIHGNSKRLFPFTHGNGVQGAFCNPANPASVAPLCDPNLTLASNVENYAAEVAWPGVGINCNACHENNSYQSDRGTLGAVINKPAGVLDPNAWNVISPQAASCTACHDSPTAIGHVTSFGGAAWGNRTQDQIAKLPRETCSDCHSPGGFKGVDIVHGLK